jgi:hypothetical protein
MWCRVSGATSLGEECVALPLCMVGYLAPDRCRSIAEAAAHIRSGNDINRLALAKRTCPEMWGRRFGASTSQAKE